MDGIENDRTDFLENGSQYAYLIDPPIQPDFAIFLFLFEPNFFAGNNSQPKHL